MAVKEGKGVLKALASLKAAGSLPLALGGGVVKERFVFAATGVALELREGAGSLKGKFVITANGAGHAQELGGGTLRALFKLRASGTVSGPYMRPSGASMITYSEEDA